MSRWEFMRQLEELLSDIPPGEREEALQYYNDYFNDAGRQNEQEVIKALGTPKQVAQIVKDGISGNGESGEFTENGFSSAPSSDRQALMKRAAESQGRGADGNTRGGTYTEGSGSRTYTGRGNTYTGGNTSGAYTGSTGSGGYTQGSTVSGSYAQGGTGSSQAWNGGAAGKSGKNGGMPAWAVALIVLGCIVASPVVIGIVSGVFSLAVGILCTVLGLVFGVGVAALVLFVVAAALIAAGFGCLWGYPLTGIGLLGGGLICAALGILCMLFTVFLAAKCIPGVCKGIRHIFRSLFDRKGGAR